MFSLRAGDIVNASGPFGDFHIKPTQREMVYIGGGAGMAPMRAHLSHLFEIENSARKVSYWYGARSRKDIFYDHYFQKLAKSHSNFSFHLALSAAPVSDAWSGLTGPIHDVVLVNHLQHHANPKAIEYYLCGPPAMVDACFHMLSSLGVPAHHISSDEF
jgi:Na(+)-translocating NADH:ubiquinone oxidoreductase F subunit